MSYEKILNRIMISVLLLLLIGCSSPKKKSDPSNKNNEQPSNNTIANTKIIGQHAFRIETVKIYRYLTADSLDNPYSKGLICSVTGFDETGKIVWEESHSPILPGGLASKTEYIYDSNGNKIEEIRSNKYQPLQRTKYILNSEGSIRNDTTYILPENQIYYWNEYFYNEHGDLIKDVSNDKKHTNIVEYNYKYSDSLSDKIIRKEVLYNGILLSSHQYDDNFQVIEEIKVDSHNEVYTKIYQYDEYGNLILEIQKFNDKSDTTKFNYNLQGKIVNKDFGKVSRNYIYDSEGELLEIQRINEDGEIYEKMKYEYR